MNRKGTIDRNIPDLTFGNVAHLGSSQYRAILCFYFTAFLPCAFCDGVAAIKEQSFHADSLAKPVVYSQIIDSQGPFIRIVGVGKTLDVMRSNLAGSVEVPQKIPTDITNDDEIAPFRVSIASIKAFSDRYPKSSQILQPHIVALSAHVSQFESGKIRHGGTWMTRLDYMKIYAKENAATNALKRQKDEDEAFAKGKREKGLELNDGKWVPKQEIVEHSDTITSELSSEVSPLQKPDLEGARQAINNLSALAARQTGTEKVRTERLLAVIKNLYAADFRVAEQVKACGSDAIEISKQEQNAKNWLIPNAFGTVNKVAARDSLLRAAEITKNSKQQLALRQKELLTQLQETDSVIHDFYKLQDYGVVLILAESVQAINDRSLAQNVFKPSFPEASLKEVRELVRNRNEWLVTANDAEIAENFEEAIRYFSKARDVTGRKRCAMRLAQNLEAGKLTGSAIDYYEIAGDFKKAALLRQQNPDLKLEAFRKLDAEDLFAKVSPCCVRILNGNSLGSGFFFRRGGYILTNGHVVSDNGPITVKLDDGRSFEAKLIEKGSDRDLAIIKIPLAEHDMINFRVGEEAKIGMPVVLIGYPEVDLPTATMNSGRISNTNRTFRGNPVYQLDVSANHGNSGGPVVDETGRLVGILTFGLNDMDKDRFNFAITGVAAHEFVKMSIPD